MDIPEGRDLTTRIHDAPPISDLIDSVRSRPPLTAAQRIIISVARSNYPPPPPPPPPKAIKRTVKSSPKPRPKRIRPAPKMPPPSRFQRIRSRLGAVIAGNN